MTEREIAAYYAGLRQAADMALIAAMTLKIRDDAGTLRQRAAIEALRGLADGLKAEACPVASVPAVVTLVAAIARDPGTTGSAACPECAGQVRWAKDAINGHIHVRCEAAGCFAVMQ